MELHKNIYCNTDSLTKGTTVKICYNGTLVSNGASEIYFHYGYGENWDNTQEIKMQATSLGFEAEIELQNSGVLNFCLRDGNNNWDNNGSSNYSCTINEPIPEETLTDDYKDITAKLDELFSNLEDETEETTETVDANYYPTVIDTSNIIERIKSFFQRIANYVPKILSGTWKRKKTEN